MSEQGWQEFLSADGVDDWVVLHGGAAAVFRVASLVEAARLAGRIAEVDGLAGAFDEFLSTRKSIIAEGVP